MEKKLLLIKKSVCLANVFAWTLTFIRTAFTFYYLLTRDKTGFPNWFLGLYIVQLIRSIFISISTCTKKQCFYAIAVVLQIYYFGFYLFFFLYFIGS